MSVFEPVVYETVAASQTDQALGPNGNQGDVLTRLVIVPAAAAAGAVSIKDGAGSSITLFAGGAVTPLADLKPLVVDFGEGIRSLSGGWSVTTGASVSAVAAGRFT